MQQTAGGGGVAGFRWELETVTARKAMILSSFHEVQYHIVQRSRPTTAVGKSDVFTVLFSRYS